MIDRKYFNLCRCAPLDKGLHWVTHHDKTWVVDIDVDDANINFDVDTPQDYAKVKEEMLCREA